MERNTPTGIIIADAQIVKIGMLQMRGIIVSEELKEAGY